MKKASYFVLLIFVLILSACQSAENTDALANDAGSAEPTALIAVTDSPATVEATEEIVLPTVEASATDEIAATAEPSATTENVVEPTRVPLPTATPAPTEEPEEDPAPAATEAADTGTEGADDADKSADPTPLLTTENGIVVNSFGFTTALGRPSETIQLAWEVLGVTDLVITRFGGEWGEAGEQWTVASAGVLNQTFPVTTGGWPVTYVLTSPEAPDLKYETTFTIPCEYDWVFSFEYPGNSCPTEPVTSSGAFQAFEGGFMIWIADMNQIMVSSWDGTSNEQLIDTFSHGIDIIIDENITAPNGYYQPDYGFGKVWRTNDSVRDLLGWALSPNVNYDVLRQGEPTSRYGGTFEYVSLPNDGLITITAPEPIWDINYPLPEITWADERPPAGQSAEAPPTVTPTPAPAVSDNGITVNRFAFQQTPSRPSDNSILEWDIDGVSEILITRYGGEFGQVNAEFVESNVGALEQSFPPDLSGWPVFYVVTTPEDPEFEYNYTVELPCEYEWVFGFDSDRLGCPEEGIQSNAAYQTFEKGFMIWIEELNVIIYSTWDGLTHAELQDTFTHGEDPVRDDTLEAPDGLLQPEYGFGKVWREESGVRDLLGWATANNRNYTILRQNRPPHRYGFEEYISLPDDGLITINHPSPIWEIDLGE